MVTDSALFTLANLGGISLLQAWPQQEEEKAEDQSATTCSEIRKRGDADAASLSVSTVLSFSTPVEVAGATTTSGSVDHSYKWRGDSGHVVLARGKKDTREENSEEEDKEEDGDVCRKEAMKVLCNVIYNSPRAQERASALR